MLSDIVGLCQLRHLSANRNQGIALGLVGSAVPECCKGGCSHQRPTPRPSCSWYVCSFSNSQWSVTKVTLHNNYSSLPCLLAAASHFNSVSLGSRWLFELAFCLNQNCVHKFIKTCKLSEMNDLNLINYKTWPWNTLVFQTFLLETRAWSTAARRLFYLSSMSTDLQGKTGVREAHFICEVSNRQCVVSAKIGFVLWRFFIFFLGNLCSFLFDEKQSKKAGSGEWSSI